MRSTCPDLICLNQLPDALGGSFVWQTTNPDMAHDSKHKTPTAEEQAKLDAAMPAADRHVINTIRVLAADMVQKPNSGHPGMPMGMAPIAYQMWSKVMKFAPNKPQWVCLPALSICAV